VKNFVRTLLTLLLILPGILASGQTFYGHYPLNKTAQADQATKEKFSHYLQISNQIMYRSPDTSLREVNTAYLEALKSRNPEEKAFCETMLGDIYKDKGSYAISSKYYYSALAWYNANNDTLKVTALLSAIADLNRAMGEYQMALDLLQTAQNMFYPYIPDRRILATIQAYKAAIYYEVLSIGFRPLVYNATGKSYPDSIYQSMDAHGREFFLKNVWSSYSTSMKICDSLLIIKNLNLLGKFNQMTGDYKSAHIYYNLAFNIIEKSNIINEKALVLSNIASTYMEQRNWDQALKFALHANIESESSGAIYYKWLAASNLYQIYKARNEFEKALKYKEKDASIIVFLYNEKARKQLYLTGQKYKTRQQTIEIQKLKNEKLFQERIDILFIILFAFILSVLILVLMMLYKRFSNAKRRKIETDKENILKAELLEKAESASKTKSGFLANISHEIRTPMSAMLGYAELLNGTDIDKVQKDYIQGILHSGKILLALINDLLDLSRFELGKTSLSPKPIGLGSLCDEVEKIVHYQLQKNNITFEKYLLNISDKLFFLDEIRLKQILLNLIGNAIKFTRDGKITLTIEAVYNGDNANLIFIINDNGIGINKDQLEIVFEPFHQSDPGVMEDAPLGFGLGLPITKKLVHLMNGTISIESEIEKGTTIKFELPNVLSADYHVNIDYSTGSSDDVIFSPSKILIAEDNPINLEVLLSYLKYLKPGIKVASNGIEVLKILKSFKPDVILLDIQMPVMDGIQTIKKIKETPEMQGIPVIALTAYSIEEIPLNVRNDFFGYLRKPISKNELVGLLKQILPFILQESGVANSPHTQSTTLSSDETAYIRQHLLPLWTETKTLMSKDEIEEFAHQVNAFGTQHSIKPLVEWATQIQTHAQNFDIKELYETFNGFQILVNSLI